MTCKRNKTTCKRNKTVRIDPGHTGAVTKLGSLALFRFPRHALNQLRCSRDYCRFMEWESNGPEPARRYPEVKLDVAVSDRHVNLIEEGYDLAIRIGELQESNLIARRLTSAHLIVCAAPAYLLRAGHPEKPTDLTRHACLIYREVETPDTWRFQDPDGRAETVRVSGPLTSTNPAFLYRLALAGHGVVIGPSFAFGTDIAEGRLIPLLTGWRSRELPINALYPHRPLLSAKIRTFVDFLAQRFAPEPEWERFLKVRSVKR